MRPVRILAPAAETSNNRRGGYYRCVRLLLAVASLSLIGSAASAQPRRSAPKSIEDNPIIGIRSADVTREWLADSSVTARCPAFVLREPIPEDAVRLEKPFRSWCVVD